MVSRRNMLKALLSLGIVSGVGYVYSNRIETNLFTITRLNFRVGLNYKIIHISDTHFDTSVYSIDSLISIIEEAEPDIIIHTGDLITTLKGYDTAIQFIERLKEIAMVYIVAGNHDHWSGWGSKGMKKDLEGLGNVYVLNNEGVKHDEIWIIGVDDPYTYHDNLSKAIEDVKGSGLKILLAHSPQIIGKVDNGIDIILSGHTHGGQIRIPFIGPLWLPLPYEYRKYDYGLFEFGRVRMFVTRGIGTTFFPLRFNCSPEVVIINL
jgi:hypothetical protein